MYQLTITTNGGTPVAHPGGFLSERDAKLNAEQQHERDQAAGAVASPARLNWHECADGVEASAEYVELLFGDFTQKTYRVAAVVEAQGIRP